MKNKLYLDGLINYNKSNKIELKNKVIERVLNKDFLNEILYESQTPILIGAEYSQKGEFKKAITEYNRALEDKDITNEEKQVAYYSMGLCFYHLKDYEASLEYLNMSEMDSVNNLQLFLEQENIKGLCYFNLNNKDKSLEIFNNILNHDNISNKIKTNINLASVYLRNYNTKDNHLVENHLNIALELANIQKEKDYELLSHLHMNRASWAEQNNDYELAINEYKIILKFDKITNYKVNVFLKLLKIDRDNKDEYLESIHQLVMASSTELEEYNDPMVFSDLSIAKIVYEYIQSKKDEMLREFLNHSVKNYDRFDSKCSIILLSVNLLYEYIDNKVLSILVYAVENYEDKEINFSLCYLNIYDVLMKVSNTDNNIKLIKQHIDKFISLLEKNARVEQSHIILLDNIITMLINEEETILASKIYDLTEKLSLGIPQELNILKVSLYDKNFELENIIDEKIRISYKVLKTLNDNHKNIDLIAGKPHDIFNNIKMKHDLYLFNNKNKLRISRKDPCPCGSGKYFKDCCR